MKLKGGLWTSLNQVKFRIFLFSFFYIVYDA